MFNKLKSKLNLDRGKTKGLTWQDDQRPGCSSTMPLSLCLKTQSYDNAFPEIDRIAESFAEVMPYVIDERGRRLEKQPPVIRALYNPNEEMSASDFFETLITMMLVHPLVHVLVWHYEDGEPVAGGPVTADNIAGFTFLENAAMSVIDGRTTFRVRDKTYTRKDVITLSLNVNPYQIMRGYSPTTAIRKWATVDDYIAQYQAAQFSNGGVPAGVMAITAPDVDSYNKAVDRIVAAYTGPDNANRIIYTHRPTSSIDGKPIAAGVEWTPFAQSNKDLTLDSLFNQANKKISTNFGVPEEVLGYLQNSNYASAEVADYVFARYVIYPKLVKVYSKLTHALNRITGGLGCALTFDYDLPVLSDARKIQVEIVRNLLDAGFTIESIVEALNLPKSYLKLSMGSDQSAENLQAQDVTLDNPSQAETSKAMHEDSCGGCCHHIKSTDNWEGVINPTLKGLLATYLTSLYNATAKHLKDGDTVEEAINKTAESVDTDASVSTLRTLIIGDLYYHLALNENENSKQFANQLQLDNPVYTLNDTEITEFNMAVQSAAAQAETMIESGQNLDNIAIAPVQSTIATLTTALSTQGIYAAIPDFAKGNNYEEQLQYLLVMFAKENLGIWKKAASDAGDADEALSLIRQAISDGEYRVNRWALTEQHRSEELGKLLSAEETGEFADLEPYKVWRIRPGACASCVALAGVQVRADRLFPNGDMVPADHPNCRCYFDIIFMPRAKSVKIFCPHCKRYMFESQGGIMKNVICANSKCKRHYDITVKNSHIDAKERNT